MTLPANIRVNVGAPFPAQVRGGGLIAISKANGIWTVSLNFAALPLTQILADPANSYALVWNPITNLVSMTLISALTASKIVKTLTAPGPYPALPEDDVLIVNQAVAAPFLVTVDWSQRTKPLTVVDGKGDANVNNITITPSLGQRQLAVVNYSYVIDGIGGNVTLTPLPTGNGAY